MDRIVEKKRIGRGFHRQAGEYDQHAVVQKRVVANLERLIEAHCNYSPRRLLDIGCGTGGYTLFCGRQGAEIYIADIDPSNVDAAATRLQETKARALRPPACWKARWGG